MPFEQWRCTRRDVLKMAGLAFAGGAWAGCDEEIALTPTAGTFVTIGSFHIVGYGMYDAFKRLRISLKKDDREVLEELIKREDLLLHVFLATGRLDPDESRGGESSQARYMKKICDFHPLVGRFAPEQNWDVAYDPERTRWFEDTYGIPTPPEVVLYHEIFGHVIPGLKDPSLIPMSEDGRFKKTKECEVLDVENRYRKQLKLPEIPRKLIRCPSP